METEDRKNLGTRAAEEGASGVPGEETRGQTGGPGAGNRRGTVLLRRPKVSDCEGSFTLNERESESNIASRWVHREFNVHIEWRQK